MLGTLAHARGRATQGWYKLSWGAGIVGAGPAVAGLARLAALRLSRRPYAHARLRSGVTVGFEVPAQVPPALVVFRTLIDPEFALLAEIGCAGVVLDVGAAIGQFTLFAAQQPGTAVHAFEPSGRNIATLQRNVSENGLADRVRVHHLALAGWEGEQEFVTQGNTYLSRPDSCAGADTETVPVRTLSGVCGALGVPRIAVLKLNVAGYEPEVLEGAEPLLERGAIELMILLIGERSIGWYERCATWGYRFFFYEPDARALHELADLTLDSLLRPPSPARHVIAVHRDAIDGGRLAAVRIVPPAATLPAGAPTRRPAQA